MNKTPTAWMLRRDGIAFPCQWHYYGNADPAEVEETLYAAEWLYDATQSEETRRRPKVMTRTNNGFEISQEDLHLRGPGDFFGQRQHGLPTLKIADLACDMQLLEEAQSAARALLCRDEDLSRPEHRPLLERVRELFHDTADSMN